MGSAREIITLQVGNYSNYIGAHWFNIQRDYLGPDSEINPLVLWRESRSQSWTPRLLLFDLKSNWSEFYPGTANTSRSTLTQSEVSQSKLTGEEWKKELEKKEKEVLWDGQVDRIEQLTRATGLNNKKQNAPESLGESSREKTEIKAEVKEDPQSWSDYIQWRFSGNTDGIVYSLSDSTHNSSEGVLSNYEQGLQIYSTIQEGVMDGIRRYAEECDYFEGFHLLVDQHDGFGGLSSGILGHIADEYEKKTCLCIGTNPPEWDSATSNGFKLRLTNIMLTWNSFNHYSSVFTSLGLTETLSTATSRPRKFPLFDYKAESKYQTSGILAASLDTITAPYRLRNPSLMLNELTGLLNAYGHKMTVFGSAFPFPLTGTNDEMLFDVLSRDGLSMLHSMMPGLPSIELEKSIGNLFVTRGIPDERVIRKTEKMSQNLHSISNAQSCIEVYSQETCPKSVNVVRNFVTPFKLSHPFPTHLVDQTYLQTQRSIRQQGKVTWNIPVMGSAHNNVLVGDMLEKMIDGAQVEKLQHSFNFEQINIEVDDYADCINEMKTLRDSYLLSQ